MRLLLCLLVVCGCILLPGVDAATVYGAIYDSQMNPVTKTVVHINSSPPQRHISRYGGYSFIVGEGEYEITAELTYNNITRTIASQRITIDQDGEYRIDLFVSDDISFEQPLEQETGYWWWWIGIILVGGIGMWGLGIWYAQRFKGNSTETSQSVVVSESEPITHPLKAKILSILDKHQGKVSQRDIRKELRYSQAKISMVLTEMEQDNTITRIKSGRSNTIIRVENNAQ